MSTMVLIHSSVFLLYRSLNDSALEHSIMSSKCYCLCRIFFYQVFFHLFFFHINRFVTKLILKILTSIMEFIQHMSPARQEHRNCLSACGRTSFSFASATIDFCLENFLKCLYGPGSCFSSAYCSNTCNVQFYFSSHGVLHRSS